MKLNITSFLLFMAIGIITSNPIYGQWQGTNPVYFNAGNVGIGTTSPLYRLQVNSATSGNLRLISNGSTSSVPSIDLYDNVNGTEFVLSPSSGKVDIFTFSNHALALGTYNAERMRITPGGNVGIGTATPAGKLDVNHAGGQIRLSGGTIAGGVWTNSTDILYLADWGTGTKGLNINMSNGNVGIGTFNPDFKLTVNGKIKAEEIQVVVDVADYVFDENYKLKSLEEVEQYIKENKHLPGVPGKAEVDVNGYQVGQMTNILLEKVEELTLYMIELKKENEELKSEVASLQTANRK